jgi:hypothetical protein
VALLPAMDIVKNVLGNAVLEKVVADAIGSIREGQSIAEPLKRGRFPPIVTHMIAVGEKSGQLENMLESVADAYDAAVETRVQVVTSLLEPLMIVVMGGAVAFIAISILMPLIQMSSFAGLTHEEASGRASRPSSSPGSARTTRKNVRSASSSSRQRDTSPSTPSTPGAGLSGWFARAGRTLTPTT